MVLAVVSLVNDPLGFKSRGRQGECVIVSSMCWTRAHNRFRAYLSSILPNLEIGRMAGSVWGLLLNNDTP